VVSLVAVAVICEWGMNVGVGPAGVILRLSNCAFWYALVPMPT